MPVTTSQSLEDRPARAAAGPLQGGSNAIAGWTAVRTWPDARDAAEDQP
jgi:hypothetical protein